jgi:hypothetical protein
MMRIIGGLGLVLVLGGVLVASWPSEVVAADRGGNTRTGRGGYAVLAGERSANTATDSRRGGSTRVGNVLAVARDGDGSSATSGGRR